MTEKLSKPRKYPGKSHGNRKVTKKEIGPQLPPVDPDMPTDEIQVIEKLANIFDGIYRYRGAYGGRNSCKSFQFALMALTRASQSRLRVLCVREFQNSLKESVMAQLITVCQTYRVLGSMFEWGTDYFRGKNGSEFLFRGLHTNHDAIKSLTDIDICWIEEAEDVSQSSLDVLLPTIRKPGSEIWATWNPKIDGSPVDKMFRKHPLPNMAIAEVSWRDNPWFTSDQNDLRLHDMSSDPERYAHIWEGAYLTRSDAQVFRNWEIGVFTMPPGTLPRYGVDWGFSNDPTAVVRCWVQGMNVYVDHEAVGYNVPMEELPDLLDRVPGIRDYPSRADSARPETIDYVSRRGFPKMQKSVKGSGSKEEGIEFLRGHKIIVHERCKHLINELTVYSYKVDKQTGQVLPVLRDKDDHLIDALRYAFEADRRNPQKNVTIKMNRINATAKTDYDRFALRR